MVAAVPSMLVDIGTLCGVFVAFAAAMALLWKTPPVRWFRTQLSESFGGWMQGQVQEANADHYEYVRYHLGPNGTTTPVHERLKTLEVSMSDIRGEQSQVRDDLQHPPAPFVDWHEPYDEDGA